VAFCYLIHSCWLGLDSYAKSPNLVPNLTPIPLLVLILVGYVTAFVATMAYVENNKLDRSLIMPAFFFVGSLPFWKQEAITADAFPGAPWIFWTSGFLLVAIAKAYSNNYLLIEAKSTWACFAVFALCWLWRIIREVGEALSSSNREAGSGFTGQ
jgi:hypothetical protein